MVWFPKQRLNDDTPFFCLHMFNYVLEELELILCYFENEELGKFGAIVGKASFLSSRLKHDTFINTIASVTAV